MGIDPRIFKADALRKLWIVLRFFDCSGRSRWVVGIRRPGKHAAYRGNYCQIQKPCCLERPMGVFVDARVCQGDLAIVTSSGRANHCLVLLSDHYMSGGWRFGSFRCDSPSCGLACRVKNLSHLDLVLVWRFVFEFLGCAETSGVDGPYQLQI